MRHGFNLTCTDKVKAMDIADINIPNERIHIIRNSLDPRVLIYNTDISNNPMLLELEVCISKPIGSRCNRMI